MGPVSLVLVLSLSDGTAAGRSVLLRTMAMSLDPQLVHLKPRVLGELPSDALSELSEHQAVVEVQWQDPSRAIVRAALRPRSWTTRTLAFSRRDPLAERAKAIAFTVAAMMPQWRPVEPVPEPEPALVVVPLSASDFGLVPPPPEEAAEVPAAPPAAGGARPGGGGVATEKRVEPPAPASPVLPAPVVPVPAPVVERVNVPERPSEPVPPLTSPRKDSAMSARSTHGFLSASAVGMLPLPVGGGALEVALCPDDRFCLGVAASLGIGQIPQLAGSRVDLRLTGIADVRLTPWWAQRLGLNVRASGGVVWVSVSRGTQQLSRWVATGALEAGPLLRLQSFDFTLTFGATATGLTTLWLGDSQVAEIPIFSALGRLGFAFRW